MMNQNKNGWILCPSKSFPGKFYYFNVLNGETAWSLNENDSQSFKRDYKITDKSHSYPEPSSPPIDNSHNISFPNNSFMKRTIYNPMSKKVINNTQMQTFGQAIFPKYVEPYMPNIIWTPIQLPPPIYAMNAPDMGMKMQTFDPAAQVDTDRILVQTCDMSMNNRFGMYTKHASVRKAENRAFSNKFYETSTPIKSFDKRIMNNSQIFGSKHNSFQKPEEIKEKSIIREPMLKRPRTHFESGQRSNILPGLNRSNSTESLLNLDNSAHMKSTLSGGSKGESSKEAKQADELDCNDLRYLLEAKRRKSVDLGDLRMNTEGRKIKTRKEETPKTTPKKRVTFDLGDQVSSEGIDDQMEDDDILLADEEFDQEVEDKTVYIAIDLDTLLDEYDFIEEYIQSDDNRKLLIPRKLQADVEAICLGDCKGRQRVIAARQITRKLVSPPAHYMPIPDPAASPNSGQGLVLDNHADNYILNTCLEVIYSGDHVMLITDKPELYNDAKSLNIDCFKTKELKDGACNTKTEVSFDLKKVPQNISNENTNLFLQPASEFEPYIVKNKEGNPANPLYDKILEEMNADSNSRKKNSFKDANTSPIDGKLLRMRDKQIDTNKKVITMPQIEKSFENTVQIGLDMQNLFIKENKNEVPPEKQNAVRFENGTEKTIEMAEKSSNINSLDDLLSVYSVKNKEMEDNIKLRLDEWICSFAQLMEEALVEVLVQHSPITDKLSPPWVLYDSIRRIQELYGSHSEVNMVTDKLKCMLLNHSSQIGKFKSSIKPNDFVKIVGCGMILVETLKSVQPSVSLQETSDAISSLLQNMSRPPEVPEFTTPLVCRERERTAEERRNYVKRPSEIIQYLKAHFEDWKDYEIPQDYDSEMQPGPTVVRTTGKDLNLLNIDKDKSITLRSHTINLMKAVNENDTTAFEKAQKSTKIDGIYAINDEKSKYQFNTGNIKESPIVFRKFDSSFIFKIRNDNKATAKNDIDVTENVEIFKRHEANVSKNVELPKAKDNVENLTNTKSINNTFTNEKTEPKIIRTFDIFKQKTNDSANKDNLNMPNHGNTTETAGPKVVRTFDNLFLPKSNDKTPKDIIEDLNVPQHGNTFADNKTTGPKVIRNLKPIDAFEDKLKDDNEKLDLDALDYSEIDRSMSETVIIENESIENVSFVYEIRNRPKPTIDKNVIEIHDTDSKSTQVIVNNDSAFNDSNDKVNDSLVNNCNSTIDDAKPNDDATNDSGFENEGVQAYSLVKIFLAELSVSVKEIYEFIMKSINEFREDETQEEKRRMLHERANTTHVIIAEIIGNLKRIIQREANEDTSIRALLLKAGAQATGDKRMTRYRQVVMKCLEQAQILENALKTVLVLTDDLDASVSNYSNQTGTRYFNIFE
ncbi:uncharacterized protein LOC114353871 isoform X2 [Ostrinia furnacalis]|uniref:uncharacterized protein LOC114353871 isoform X2 n=1 Tax=Ostrinia furnacalis TaxID=93504 RepID=UPI00103D8DBA|nr:uncharacterized protein LOC114353871 isoform X2 [Ostrinia furnacalis]